MTYVIALLIVALVGNWVIRRVLAKADRGFDIDAAAPTPASGVSPVQTGDILREWGRQAPGWELPEAVTPMHDSVGKLLAQYEFIGPDKYLTVLDRSLACVPFSMNQDFVQIGALGDGSEVVVKRDPDDSRIYYTDCECGRPEKPEVFADSVATYLSNAWNEHHQSPGQG